MRIDLQIIRAFNEGGIIYYFSWGGEGESSQTPALPSPSPSEKQVCGNCASITSRPDISQYVASLTEWVTAEEMKQP